MMAAVRANDLCMNCLRPGHFVKQCKSLHKCHECQRPHHTLLHVSPRDDPVNSKTKPVTNQSVTSNTATKAGSSSLLMTCNVLVTSPSGHSTQVRALLDSGSSACFMSHSLARHFHLRRLVQPITISGIAGITHSRSTHEITTFHISSLHRPSRQFEVPAIVVPKVTCDLPTHSVAINPLWIHLQGLTLADPDFGQFNTIDVLLGVDIFIVAWPVAWSIWCSISSGNRIWMGVSQKYQSTQLKESGCYTSCHSVDFRWVSTKILATGRSPARITHLVIWRGCRNEPLQRESLPHSTG